MTQLKLPPENPGRFTACFLKFAAIVNPIIILICRLNVVK